MASNEFRDEPEFLRQRAPSLVKPTGCTPSENILGKLCTKSFLSLWSYQSVYRNQGRTNGGDGKELCDLLVVFGDDVIIFSDKDCKFPSTGELGLDWSRWYRRAIRKSAEQLWGAERWISQFPDQVYLDRQCQHQLPVKIPQDPRIFRVLVAHDAARRNRELFGGSGSLMLFTRVTGEAHEHGPIPLEDAGVKAVVKTWKDKTNFAGSVMPFTIGDIDPDRGFVHVLDDVGIKAVMRGCDTIADFVHYLASKEALLRSGRNILAAGEEELLAYYLTQTKHSNGRVFHVPAKDSNELLVFPEGEWKALLRSPEWAIRREANEISYDWDDLIENISHHILGGTSPAYPSFAIDLQELSVRAMASEPRVRRRALSAAFNSLVYEGDWSSYLRVRVVEPEYEGRPFYIFIVMRRSGTIDRSAYSAAMQGVMHNYAKVLKLQYPSATQVVVIGTEPLDQRGHGVTQVMYLELPSDLSAEEIEEAKEIQSQTGFLTKLHKRRHVQHKDFPVALGEFGGPHTRPGKQKSARNSPCPCGSGRKFKQCCMRYQVT